MQTDTTTTTKQDNSNGKSTDRFPLHHMKGDVKGMVTLDQDVVATIAGLAAREVDGIHALGKSRLISFGDDPTRGVDAEVGKFQAAIDLDVVIEYGCDMDKMANELRTRIVQEVGLMAKREVVEVNINVVDIKLPEPATDTPETTEADSRVV